MHRYQFESPEINKELEKLTSFFHQKNFAPDTIKVYCNYTGYFLNWLRDQSLTAGPATYNHLLQFINHCKKEGRKSRNINLVLTALRHYYDMLQLKQNPASGLQVRGEVKTIPHDLLSPEALHQLYESYPDGDGHPYNERTQRNKVILGLYVYQGITTDEVKKLEPKHVRLKEGKIYIPATKQTHHKGGRKSRWLKLKANQILDMQEYLLVTRPKILADLKNGTRQSQPTRKPDKIKWQRIEEQLFISLNGSENIKNSIRHLMDELREILPADRHGNPQIKDAQQIRQSVIVNWLKGAGHPESGIRQVQYLAGHSSISSTERYRAANLEELEEALKIHHPLA
jgi:integrase/recombinase XerD